MIQPLAEHPDLLDIAKRCVWFKQPQEALKNPIHFIAYVLTYGTHEDVLKLKQHLDSSVLEQAIIHAPAGIFDDRSWTYWNLMIGRYPPPPKPQRKYADS